MLTKWGSEIFVEILNIPFEILNIPWMMCITVIPAQQQKWSHVQRIDSKRSVCNF